MTQPKSPADRLLREISPRTSGGFTQAALVDAQRKAGVLVVDLAAYSAMSTRALPQLGEESRFPVGGDAPIFDALTAELGPALQA